MVSALFKIDDDTFHIFDPYYGGLWEFNKQGFLTFLNILDELHTSQSKLKDLLLSAKDPDKRAMLTYIQEERIPIQTTTFPSTIEQRVDTRQSGILSMPEIIFEVNRTCNYQCPWCYIPNMAQADPLLSFDLIENNLIKPFVSQGAKCWTLTGGEPSCTLDRTLEIIRMIKHHTETMCKFSPDISILTNGFNLAQYAQQYWDAGVRAIQIHLSSPEEAEENRLRNPKAEINSFRHAVDGILRCKDLGFYLSINMVIVPENIHSIAEMISLIDSLGGVNSLRITPAVTAGMAKSNDITLDLLNYDRIAREVEKGKEQIGKTSELDILLPSLDIEKGRPIRCGLGFLDFYVDYHGRVYPCNNLIAESFVCDPGTLREFDGPTIWYESNLIHRFRNYQQTNIAGECADCDYRGKCVGNCLARCWHQFGKFDLVQKPDSCFRDIV